MILIETAKKNNTTIYIGCFDIEKAFDKVSRLLLLKKLINLYYDLVYTQHEREVLTNI